MRKLFATCAAVPLLASCHREPPSPPAKPHYELGAAWHGTNGWFYPVEQFDYRASGLAVRQPANQRGLTADGELRSDLAMTGAHQTLQLPAIVSVRNLRNGRIVKIRLTDRGPTDAGRIIALSQRAADLLGMESDAPVEVIEDEGASRALADSTGRPPSVAVAAAPVGEVRATSLNDGSSTLYGNDSPRTAETTAAAPLPATWTQGMPGPTGLYILMGVFSGRGTAAGIAARCNGTVHRSREAAAGLDWQVLGGPYVDVAQADAALDRTRQCGVEGARIIVE